MSQNQICDVELSLSHAPQESTPEVSLVSCSHGYRDANYCPRCGSDGSVFDEQGHVPACDGLDPTTRRQERFDEAPKTAYECPDVPKLVDLLQQGGNWAAREAALALVPCLTHCPYAKRQAEHAEESKKNWTVMCEPFEHLWCIAASGVPELSKRWRSFCLRMKAWEMPREDTARHSNAYLRVINSAKTPYRILTTDELTLSKIALCPYTPLRVSGPDKPLREEPENPRAWLPIPAIEVRLAHPGALSAMLSLSDAAKYAHCPESVIRAAIAHRDSSFTSTVCPREGNITRGRGDIEEESKPSVSYFKTVENKQPDVRSSIAMARGLIKGLSRRWFKRPSWTCGMLTGSPDRDLADTSKKIWQTRKVSMMTGSRDRDPANPSKRIPVKREDLPAPTKGLFGPSFGGYYYSRPPALDEARPNLSFLRIEANYWVSQSDLDQLMQERSENTVRPPLVSTPVDEPRPLPATKRNQSDWYLHELRHLWMRQHPDLPLLQVRPVPVKIPVTETAVRRDFYEYKRYLDDLSNERGVSFSLNTDRRTQAAPEGTILRCEHGWYLGDSGCTLCQQENWPLSLSFQAACLFEQYRNISAIPLSPEEALEEVLKGDGPEPTKKDVLQAQELSRCFHGILVNWHDARRERRIKVSSSEVAQSLYIGKITCPKRFKEGSWTDRVIAYLNVLRAPDSPQRRKNLQEEWPKLVNFLCKRVRDRMNYKNKKTRTSRLYWMPDRAPSGGFEGQYFQHSLRNFVEEWLAEKMNNYRMASASCIEDQARHGHIQGLRNRCFKAVRKHIWLQRKEGVLPNYDRKPLPTSRCEGTLGYSYATTEELCRAGSKKHLSDAKFQKLLTRLSQRLTDLGVDVPWLRLIQRLYGTTDFLDLKITCRYQPKPAPEPLGVRSRDDENRERHFRPLDRLVFKAMREESAGFETPRATYKRLKEKRKQMHALFHEKELSEAVAVHELYATIMGAPLLNNAADYAEYREDVGTQSREKEHDDVELERYEEDVEVETEQKEYDDMTAEDYDMSETLPPLGIRQIADT
jgi:hypothetical protein